jgi:signal transduction histidine kinase/CheY-like chemotaxis protein
MKLGRGILLLGILLEITGLVTTALGGWVAQRSEDQQAEEEFRHAVERGQVAIRNRLDAYQQGLLSGAVFLGLQKDASPEMWRRYVEGMRIEENFPGINGFGRISPVPRADLSADLERQASENPSLKYRGFPRVIPETSMVIDRIEPFDRNKAALGLDVATEGRRREAARRALVSGKPAITRIVLLVQDSTKHPGFLMLVPFYRTGMPVSTPQERIRAFAGWSYAPFVGAKTLVGLAQATGASLCFDVYDERVETDNRIYNGCGGRDSTGRSAVRRMPMAGRSWVVVWKEESPAHGGGGLLSRALVVLGALNFLGILALMFWIHRRADRALAQAEEASRQKDDFLAVMSHEIRTPLNGVLSGIELLEKRGVDAESAKLLGIIRGSGQGLLGLVSEILDFAKLERGGLELESKVFDPEELVHSCTESMRALAGSKGVGIEVAVGEGVGWRRGDPMRCRQVLANLLSNAVKFTENGSVSVSLAGGPEGIEVVVRDTGIGMDASALRNLFQPFRQADASIGRRFGGTGLGLAIVKRIVERMSGSIHVESIPGRGTSFRVVLPLERLPPPPPKVAELAENVDFVGRRILAVDDNEINLEVARGLLEFLGCRVETANDGTGAVAAAMNGTWDAILMDCRMPGMDGLEATRLIRSYGSRVPIIALTANAFPSDREACEKAGMDGFLSKPVLVDSLRTALATVLRDSG